jgi:2-polyprenyl-3-methyl-5-hydroxy-6-metoxy-1,4-benzoquinol methylase
MIMAAENTFFNRVIDLYEEMPYPNVPLTSGAADKINQLFKASYQTAQYARTRGVVSTEGTVMLNAGCGSGWETLVLAEANPGASIVAIDLSLESVKVAERRLRYQGFTDIQVFAIDILDLSQLNIQFDFVSCNDVLYLLDSPLDGLKAMRNVLKPEGIIRANLHNIYTRRGMLEMQKAFRILGLNQLPRNQAAEYVREFMSNLTKQSTQSRGWDPKQYSENTTIMNNYLLAGDKGFSIVDTFEFLEGSGLTMVSLVDYPNWNIRRLFKTMPKFLADRLESMNQKEQLHLCELIFPNGRRLIDFWAEHKDSSLVFPWTDEQWLNGEVMLNPLMHQYPSFRENLTKAVRQKVSLTINWPGAPNGMMRIPADKVAWIEVLLSGQQPVKKIIELCSMTNRVEQEQATEEVLAYLQALEDYFFVMLISEG